MQYLQLFGTQYCNDLMHAVNHFKASALNYERRWPCMNLYLFSFNLFETTLMNTKSLPLIWSIVWMVMQATEVIQSARKRRKVFGWIEFWRCYRHNYCDHCTTAIHRGDILCHYLFSTSCITKKRKDACVMLDSQFRCVDTIQTNDRCRDTWWSKHADSNLSEDVEPSIIDEFIQFCHFAERKESDQSVLQMHKLLKHRNLESTFPNIYILFRTYLCLPVTSAAYERSFSALNRMKNYHRSTMTQERLCSLAAMAIESDVLKLPDFDDVVTEFAHSRSRKRIVWTVLLNVPNCLSVTGMHCQCHWFQSDTLYYIIINNSYICIIIYTQFTMAWALMHINEWYFINLTIVNKKWSLKF